MNSEKVWNEKTTNKEGNGGVNLSPVYFLA